MTVKQPGLLGGNDFSRRLSAAPQIFIDGYPIPSAGWGRIVTPAAPGRHHLHAYVWDRLWKTKYGQTDAIVDVAPGQWVQLEYRVPILNGRASLGPAAAGGTRMNLSYVLWGVTFFAVAIPLVFALIFALIGAK